MTTDSVVEPLTGYLTTWVVSYVVSPMARTPISQGSFEIRPDSNVGFSQCPRANAETPTAKTFPHWLIGRNIVCQRLRYDPRRRREGRRSGIPSGAGPDPRCAHTNACLSSIQHLSPAAVDDSQRLATRLRCVNVEVKSSSRELEPTRRRRVPTRRATATSRPRYDLAHFPRLLVTVPGHHQRRGAASNPDSHLPVQ